VQRCLGNFVLPLQINETLRACTVRNVQHEKEGSGHTPIQTLWMRWNT
jgi:hypothetical protein